MTSLLDPELRGDDERHLRAEPRPGVWWGDRLADRRPLTQEDTDLLVRAELLSRVGSPNYEELVSLCGRRHHLKLELSPRLQRRGLYVVPGTSQRGGLDSEALVRLAAGRVWRDRDLRWSHVPHTCGARADRPPPLLLAECAACVEVELHWSAAALAPAAGLDALTARRVEIGVAVEGRVGHWYREFLLAPRDAPHAGYALEYHLRGVCETLAEPSTLYSAYTSGVHWLGDPLLLRDGDVRLSPLARAVKYALERGDLWRRPIVDEALG